MRRVPEWKLMAEDLECRPGQVRCSARTWIGMVLLNEPLGTEPPRVNLDQHFCDLEKHMPRLIRLFFFVGGMTSYTTTHDHLPESLIAEVQFIYQSKFSDNLNRLARHHKGCSTLIKKYWMWRGIGERSLRHILWMPESNELRKPEGKENSVVLLEFRLATLPALGHVYSLINDSCQRQRGLQTNKVREVIIGSGCRRFTYGSWISNLYI